MSLKAFAGGGCDSTQPYTDKFDGVALAQHLGAHLHNGHPTVGHDMSSPNVGGPQDQNIDPAIAGPGMIMANAGDGGPDENGIDMKKGGKRELSTSKRAAQNRAAQVRSFTTLF